MVKQPYGKMINRVFAVKLGYTECANGSLGYYYKGLRYYRIKITADPTI
jgi:hypothetical protein